MVEKSKRRDSAKVDMTDLMTQAEAAELRGVSRAAITDLVKRGRLRIVKMFGKKLVYRSEVEHFEPVRKGWPKGKARK
jgi:excisionase family DNA binding protein